MVSTSSVFWHRYRAKYRPLYTRDSICTEYKVDSRLRVYYCVVVTKYVTVHASPLNNLTAERHTGPQLLAVIGHPRCTPVLALTAMSVKIADREDGRLRSVR